MEKLNIDYEFVKGKYKGKTVRNLAEIPGKIFSMIKEGYTFDDEVLETAHIKKTIRDVEVKVCVGGLEREPLKPLSVETASLRQVLKELNTITSMAEGTSNFGEDNTSSEAYNNSSEMVTVDNYNDDEE